MGLGQRPGGVSGGKASKNFVFFNIFMVIKWFTMPFKKLYTWLTYEKQGWRKIQQNSEAIDVWKVTCHQSSRHVVVCDKYFF